jgi:hypothetical protein
VPQRGQLGEQVQHDRHGDVVRQVRDQRGRRRVEVACLDLEGVDMVDGEPADAGPGPVPHGRAEGGRQRGIDLDGVHVSDGRQQPEGERTEAGTHLDDDVARVEIRGGHDAPDGVRVVHEVLPEPLRRRDPEAGRQLADLRRPKEVVHDHPA